jgi:hypothetical protein
MRTSAFISGLATATTVLAGSALVAPAAHASTFNFTASGESTLTSLGNQINTYGFSPFDQLAIPSNAGTFTPGTPFTLNVLAFTVGINATIPDVTSTYDITETVTFGAGPGPGSLTIPFDITISYQDDIHAISSTFGALPGGWSLSLSAPDTGLVSTGQTFSYDLTALVTTPLPAALPLFAGGLGMLSLMGGRRRRSNKQSGLASA